MKFCTSKILQYMAIVSKKYFVCIGQLMHLSLDLNHGLVHKTMRMQLSIGVISIINS
jgi:hypothetical protein